MLELACGTGELALAACERAGPNGLVLATDYAPQMVAGAAARLERAQTDLKARVATRVMDAEALDVPDASFDVVICSFGLMFCPNAPRAAAEAHRVLRPGGRFAASVWASNAYDSAVQRTVDKITLSLGVASTSPKLSALRFAGPGLAEEALRAGGFRTLQCETIALSFHFAERDHLWSTASNALMVKVRELARSLGGCACKWACACACPCRS